MSRITAKGGTVWQTALDVDFSTQPSQTLTVNGNYTIGGYTFTKVNSLHDSVAMAVVNGTGLVITPDQVSTFSAGIRTAPALNASLAAFYEYSIRIRAMVYFTETLAAVGDFAVLAFDNPTIRNSEICYKAYVGVAEVYLARLAVGGGALGADFTAAWPLGHDMLCMYHETNIGMLGCTAATSAGAWPAVGAWQPQALRMGGTPALVNVSTSLLATDWNVLIGAGRGGSVNPLVVVVKKLKIEYAE